MIENDYTDLCNLAFELQETVRRYLDQLSEETLRGLESMQRGERQASLTLGGMPAVYAFLEASLREEIVYREAEASKPIELKLPTASNEVPF